MDDPSYPYFMHRNQNTSWLGVILPFIERSDLYDQLPAICFNTSRTYEDYRNQTGGPEKIFEIPEVAFVMQQDVPVFRCPSDGLPPGKEMTGGTQPCYVGDVELDAYLYFYLPGPASPSNYSGCSGAYSGGNVPDPQMQIYDGIFGSRIQKRLSEVTDGTSQSILAGEQLGTIINRERVLSSSWLFQHLARARSDLTWKSWQSPRSPGLQLLGDDWFAHSGGFASMHPTTVNFAMIDGSVRPIRRTIDWQTLYSLAGIHDHDVIAE